MTLPPSWLNPNYLIQDLRVGLWLVAIGYLLLFAKDFIYRSKKTELVNQKKLFFGIAIFFILYACTRILFLISDYSYLHIDNSPISENVFGINWSGGFYYQFFWQIGSDIGLFGFTVLVYSIERYLLENKTKLIFSFIGLGLIGATIILGQIVRNSLYIALAFMGAVPIFLYFYYSNSLEGEMKKKAILCGISFLLFLGGMAIDSTFFQNFLFPLNIDSKIIGTSMVIIGLFLLNHIYSSYELKK